MKIVFLDYKTLGDDIDLSEFLKLGDVEFYEKTIKDDVISRISDCECIVVNKVVLNSSNLSHAKNLKLICETATGYDNIDIDYCKEKGIAVCNVEAYSTDSVAQLTLSMALSLSCHIREYSDFTISGGYTKSGIQNCLTPTFHELSGKTWGIVGYGNIGKKVAKIAEALSCKVIYTRNSPDDKSVDIDELCEKSDIISIHTPLTPKTEGLINWKRICMMSKKPIVINVARGKIFDEFAICRAIKENRISGLGVDVYSTEPFGEKHPYNEILDYYNVILTPHMAWGAFEARVRCMNEVLKNVKAFINGEKRSRIDIK